MGTYLQSGGGGKAYVDIKEAIALMKEKFEIVEQMFYGYDYKSYFKSRDKYQTSNITRSTELYISIS